MSYIYDKNGNVITRTPDNGNSSSFLYDAVNRVTSITHNFVGNTRTLNYAYDAIGRRKYVERVGDAVGDDGYSYDLNSQTTGFTRDGALAGGTVVPGTTGTVAGFYFDASGNRTSVVDGGTTTYTTNYLNQYTAITGVAAPTYDNNGNLLTHNGSTYTYDAMNRLTKVVKGATTEEFWYDGLNRQIGRKLTVGGVETKSVMSGMAGICMSSIRPTARRRGSGCSTGRVGTWCKARS